MALSPYLEYSFKSLVKEGKYSVMELSNKKIKVFEPEDIWLKILDFYDIVQNSGQGQGHYSNEKD